MSFCWCFWFHVLRNDIQITPYLREQIYFRTPWSQWKPKNSTQSMFLFLALWKRCFPYELSAYVFLVFRPQHRATHKQRRYPSDSGPWTQFQHADGMARASHGGAARATDDEGGWSRGVEVNNPCGETEAALTPKKKGWTLGWVPGSRCHHFKNGGEPFGRW